MDVSVTGSANFPISDSHPKPSIHAQEVLAARAAADSSKAAAEELQESAVMSNQQLASLKEALR